MATQVWHYLINSFYAQTRKSAKIALSLTADHLAKLTANQSDPDIAAMRATYLPYHDAFEISYNQLQSRLGLYKGKTQSTEEFLEELAEKKINEWRGIVFSIFPEGTADAKAIFSKGRSPFNSGPYELRIEAVEVLSKRLATYTAEPLLVNLSTAVDAYYNNIKGARALQQMDEGSVALLRGTLKANHKLLCVGLYRNLGLLMAKYAENPVAVKRFFDLTLLRPKGKKEMGDEEV